MFTTRVYYLTIMSEGGGDTGGVCDDREKGIRSQ